MKFPAEGVQIIDAFLATAAGSALAHGSDDQRRSLVLMIAQQMAHDVDPRWGTKSASPTRPQSKDALAFSDGATLFGWDCFNGDTRERQVVAGAEGEVLTDQNFIRVDPRDRLAELWGGKRPDGDTGGGTTTGGTTDTTQLRDEFTRVRQQLQEMGVSTASLVHRIEELHDATERQYADIVRHLDDVVARIPDGFEGSARLPYIPGAVRFDLTAKKGAK